MPDSPDDVAARLKARAHLTDAQRNGLSFYDAIVRSLFAGGHDEEKHFPKKVRRRKTDADVPWSLSNPPEE